MRTTYTCVHWKSNIQWHNHSTRSTRWQVYWVNVNRCFDQDVDMSGIQVNFLSVCQPNNCFGPYSLPFSFVAVSSLVSLLSPIYLSLSLYLESTFWIRHHEFLELWVRRFNTSALPSLCSSQCSVSAANENKPAKPNRPHRYHPSHCSYAIHTWLIC